jgi:putative ABC transport system permease protein
VPIRRQPQQTQYRSRRVTAEIVGTVSWYTEMVPIQVRMGRFLSVLDLHYNQAVCVIEETLLDTLFKVDDPIGQQLKIAGEYYTIVGIVYDGSAVEDKQDNAARNMRDGGVSGRVYLPLSTMKSRIGETQIQFGGSTGSSGEKIELSEITIKVPTMERVLPTRDVLAYMLEQFHKKRDYQIIVPLELLRQAARTKRIFSIVLGSIAAISLLGGGIGIMNIMLATVSERTREIGIRRALGARKKDIVLQFLSETILLTVIGGILGMALGACIPILVSVFGGMPTVITAEAMILSFSISAGVGLTFGLYPAYHAANMDPIESLRHE